MKTLVRVLRARDVSAISSNMSAVSRIQCETVCVKSEINGCCRICGYDTVTKTCFLSFNHEDDLIVHSDDTRMVLFPDRTVYEDAEYLVNGRNPVPDDQISTSSVWADDPSHGTIGARLNSTPSLTTVGAWAAGSSNANQYIQVQFNGLSHVMGVAIQGRPVNTDPSFEHLDCCSQRVTSYKLVYSYDCAYFLTVKDCNGSDRIFVGNTDQNTVVTTMLPSPVAALCVKINPVTWSEHISMRFDILGRSIN